jgi:8-oxo-dGTP diphosphatase
VWLARITVGEPRPLEDHDRLRVLTKFELHAVRWLPADVEIIAALAALIN